jgi:hypothetical protein
MVYHAGRTMTPNMVHIRRFIDFYAFVLTLTPMEKSPEKKKSEHPVVVLIIFTLLLIPILIVFGGKSYT